MKVPFSKLTGSGNDFVLVDNTQGLLDVEYLREKVPKICARALSVGADGVIILEPSRVAHFKWRFFNSDASEAEMCGNGGRCVARFAYEKGIAPRELTFETLAGIVKAKVFSNNRDVEVQLPLLLPLRWGEKLRLDNGFQIEFSFLNAGVPHVVTFIDDLEGIDVNALGRKIRFHPLFLPAGTNVDFVQIRTRDRLVIRTYERGVERETLACGTGAAASAFVYLGSRERGEVEVETKSGETLVVKKGDNNVFLMGSTRWIYDGELREESWW